MLRFALIAVVVLLVAGLAYVRLAPSDPARWHVAPENRAPGDYPGDVGHEARRLTDDPQMLVKLDAIALATPRTTVLAGSPEAGMTTYVTRSRLMGYPDYTTVLLETGTDGQSVLVVHARSRFGGGDMGVNRARVTGWLDELGLGGA